MIANRYVIAIFVVIAVPLLTFTMRGKIAEYANKYISIFADTATFESVVRLTEDNRGIFDMLKNGRYEFNKFTALDNVDDKKLAQYFGGISSSLEAEKEKKKVLPSLLSLKTIPKKNIRKAPSKKYERSFKVTFIYFGEKEKYAIIDGQLIKQGAKLASGYIVEEIQPDKVKVKTPGGFKWFTVNI